MTFIYECVAGRCAFGHINRSWATPPRGRKGGGWWGGR